MDPEAISSLERLGLTYPNLVKYEYAVNPNHLSYHCKTGHTVLTEVRVQMITNERSDWIDLGSVAYSLSEESTPSSSNRQLFSPLAFITRFRFFDVSLSRVASPDDSSTSNQLWYNP